MKGINHIFAAIVKVLVGGLATCMALPSAQSWSQSVPGLVTPMLAFVLLTIVSLLPFIVGCCMASDNLSRAFKNGGLRNR